MCSKLKTTNRKQQSHRNGLKAVQKLIQTFGLRSGQDVVLGHQARLVEHDHLFVSQQSSAVLGELLVSVHTVHRYEAVLHVHQMVGELHFDSI